MLGQLFSHIAYFWLYLCISAFAASLLLAQPSPFNLFGCKVVKREANTLAAITLSSASVDEVRKSPRGRFFFHPSCSVSVRFFYSYSTFWRLPARPAPQWGRWAQNILSTPILFAVGCHTDRPHISSHKSVSSLQRFLAGLVSSNPTVSLAKRWLGMTLERLTVGPVATGNQQQHKYSMGKASATPRALLASPADVSCSLSLLCRPPWHWASSTHWLPAAFKERLAPLSLRGDERERNREMKNVIPLKDKKISHHDCNDGAGQGGGSAGRRRMSLVKNQSSVFGKRRRAWNK